MDLILYNPLSKNSKSNVQTHKLVRQYKTNKVPFRLKSILKIDDIKTYLDNKKEIDKVILLGGDGTVNRFVNDIVDYNLIQDIMLKPNGSGNDYMRSLVDRDSEPQFIMQSTYDTGFKTHFINGTGMGVDGYVGYLVDQNVKKGVLGYFKSTIKALLTYIPEPLTLTVDGEVTKFEKAYLVTMNNGRYFGGGMKVAPEGNINDEYLDVVVAHSANKLQLIFIFLTIYIGKHTKFKKYIFNKKGKHIKAEFTTPQITQADGENYYDVTTIEVKSTGKQIHFKCFDK